ncbi:hypothetical protein DENSPDRAFT_787497 [Dentipellis sp. KUC8613]|nr:hypothetical protein DENSPDRAFT_787497 [Dentipellis sp. KUC8613]
MADTEAKKAAAGDASPSAQLPKYLRSPIPRSIVALRQAHHADLKARAALLWQQSPRYARYSAFDKRLPGPGYLKTVANISRAQASIYFQLRSGHVALNQYLHRIAHDDERVSATCSACNISTESVHHFMLECPAYRRERHHLERLWRHRALDLRFLLSSRDALTSVLQYIKATGRFPHLGEV